ncbi:MAG: nucleotide-diphospho-sugar transferase [Cyclobacteriaceae bacterium]
MKVPVLLLIYNRPDKTARVLQSISNYKPDSLYIASDGPKYNNDQWLIEKTRKEALDIPWDCKVNKLFRSENLGCKEAVSQGINWFFEHEEMGIIIEDDCLPDASFFPFCEELLIRYKDDSRLGMISGTNQFANQIPTGYSYFFASNASIWGWATWRRAWETYDVTMADWPKLRNTKFLKHHTFNFLEMWRRRSVYDDVYNGRIDTWDFQWTFSRQKSNLISIVPKNNLVQNIGMDEEGTHLNSSYIDQIDTGEVKFPLDHPPKFEVSRQFDRLLSQQLISEGILRNILYLLIKRPLKRLGLL